MLCILGSDGSLFEMRVVGYQFPELQTEWHDSNWLRIWIHVVHPKGEWSSIDASLLTNEVEALAKWFDAIAKGHKVEAVQDFVEPHLSFRLLDHEGGQTLAIYFESASRPRWARSETVPAEDLFIEFPLSELDLTHTAEQLRLELARYPQRAER